MNPNNMKRYQNLLWLGVPAKKRDSVRGERSTRYIDYNRVAMLELTTPPWCLESTEVMQYETYVSDIKSPVKMPTIFGPSTDERSMICPVSYLKQIVDNIGSDSVRITIDNDYPIMLEWKDGEDSWKAIIAPRIETE